MAGLMTGNRDYLMRIVTADLAAFEMFITGKLTMVKAWPRSNPQSLYAG